MRTETSSTVDGRWTVGPAHVMVGVDGESLGGRRALAWGVSEAVALGGRLTVCRAGTPRADRSVDPLLMRDIEVARRRLGWGRVVLRSEPGDAVDTLCVAAGEADLLVVGGPVDGNDAASVATGAAAGAMRPVIVVRTDSPGSTGRPFDGSVAVAVAGACVDPLALAFGFEYAEIHGIPLVAVHVDPGKSDDRCVDAAAVPLPLLVESRPMRVLAAAVAPFRSAYPGVRTGLMALCGDPVERLRREVAGSARLTVVARRASLLGRRSLGSVTRTLVAEGPGSVAVVPPHWYRRVH